MNFKYINNLTLQERKNYDGRLVIVIYDNVRTELELTPEEAVEFGAELFMAGLAARGPIKGRETGKPDRRRTKRRK